MGPWRDSFGRLGRLAVAGLALQASSSTAIELNIDDASSVKSAAKIVANGMMSFYTGNQPGQTPGILPQPYYWWEVGAMFGAMIDYWYYTGDRTWNPIVTQGMLFQVGDQANYQPINQTFDLGNDDQAFWGMAAMSAAENKYPDPPEDEPQWLALAQAVFNAQAGRWDNANCHGGLRWQVFFSNQGYDYKNSISNGCFFNLAARLALYTGNHTYADWAVKTWNWTLSVNLIDEVYHVWDGTWIGEQCTKLNRLEWSYNVGVYLLGTAVMWNITGDEQWRTHTEGLLKASDLFFPVDDIMEEVQCEPQNNCDTDNLSFKAYLARWMAATTKVAPWTYDLIMPKLRASATAAAAACSGGTNNTMCGLRWNVAPHFDGSVGVGQQMNALEVISSMLITDARGPATSTNGGTSKGDPGAGSGSASGDVPIRTYNIDTADRAGAGIITAVLLSATLGSAVWAVWGSW